MRQVSAFAFAAAAALSATAARAADMPYIPPQEPVCIPRGSVPPGFKPHLPYCEEAFARWYLRGDIGMTNQRVGALENVLFPLTPSLVIRDKNFESGMLFGLGIGYQWNDWLRTDFTGEYRGEVGFHGLDTWTDGGGNARFNNYTAKKSEWLFLANAYLDLGTWWHMTPFVGAGIGFSRNTVHSFRDAGIDPAGAPTLAYADAASKWNFAWALHAGIALKATKNLTIELAYRYVSLGHATTGDLIAYDGTNNFYNPMEFKNLSSHDVKLGIRYAFDADFGLFSAYREPVYVRPEPSYAPPVYEPAPSYQKPYYPPHQPVYQQELYQPPLRQRG
jgi:opacity protein-like surface antigen